MPQAPTIVVPSPSHLMTADKLARQLAAQRNIISRSASHRPQEEYKRLQAMFAVVSDRTRGLFADPRIKQPELAVLMQIAHEAGEASKLICDELQRVERGDAKIAPPEPIEQLLGWNHKALDRLENQLWLLDCIDGYSEGYREAVTELFVRGSTSPGRFQYIARRMVLDLYPPQGGEFLLHDETISLRSRLAGLTCFSDPTVVATGIEAGRLMALASEPICSNPQEREILIIAALLQDVGLLGLVQKYRMPAGRLAQEQRVAYESHPTQGAAVAAGIQEYSVDLPFLIAKHHERLAGTGFPRRLPSRSLPQAAKLMCIVSRMVELLGPCGDAEGRDMTRHMAAARLMREAEQGEFDASLTKIFLQQLGYELKTGTQKSDARWRVDEPHENRVPAPRALDSAHQSVAVVTESTNPPGEPADDSSSQQHRAPVPRPHLGHLRRRRSSKPRHSSADRRRRAG